MSHTEVTFDRKKFSLIDLLMILMLVGIVFTFIIPLREDRRNHERVKEAIRDVRIIIQANLDFRNDPDNGYFAFDLSQLNIDHLLNGNYFEYSLTDSTVNAKSNANYSTEGALFYYYLPSGPWLVSEDELSRSVVNPNWLP